MRALLRVLFPYSARVMLAVALGATVIVSTMGLLAAAAYLIAAAAVTHLMAVLIIPMYAVRILSATRGAARYAERLVSHRVTFDVLARLRVSLFDRLRGLGPAGMQALHSGDALGRVIADVEQLQDGYLLFVSPALVALGVAALLTALLLAFSQALAWSILGYVLACGVVLPLAAGWLASGAGREMVAARAELTAHLVDSIQGSRDILSNGADSRYGEQTAAHGLRLAAAEGRLAAVHAGREGGAELLSNLAVLTALALAVPLVTRHAILGLYVAVPALLTLAACEAIRPLGQATETWGGVRAAGRRVLELGDNVGRGPRSPSLLGGGALLRGPTLRYCPAHQGRGYVAGGVTFAEVTLTYPEAGRPAVQGVSFEVPAGHQVAVVGASGAGKTSLVWLLTRAWEPTAGRVLLGGRDIREYALSDVRRALAVVTQDTYIFDDTVRSNLLLARPEASAADLEEALQAVGLREMVQGLPQGLDTWVGEHGARLSGGERQRLAAARALLQDAPIVVLDEVTAHLDAVTERALLDTLQRATRGRTVLTITHRLVGLERMDEIIVLDRGQVAERGTHERLRAAGGLYQRMLDVQENMLEDAL